MITLIAKRTITTLILCYIQERVDSHATESFAKLSRIDGQLVELFSESNQSLSPLVCVSTLVSQSIIRNRLVD